MLSEGYRRGWNARHLGFLYDAQKSYEWKLGFEAYGKAKVEDQLEMR
jgi:hypothetical protein